MASNADQRPNPPPMRAGLRRPDYGPMQPRVFKKFPTTPHVTRRRTVAVDEGLLEAFYQTHIGNQPSTPGGNRGLGRDEDPSSRQNTPGTRRQSNVPAAGDPGPSEWMNEPNDPNYIPRTPRRESRTINVAPGSGRRTPRRRSRSNAGLTQRTTPLKALADANQARVNRLISEANRRGRVGRDKHSPMGILRVLSRIPGFNPPPKPSPDRQPLPGSEQWRKLTPKSTRTQHIEEFTAPTAGSSSQSPSKRTSTIGHDRTPSAKSSTPSAEYMQAREDAFRQFVAENPFQDPEDFNKLWDEDLSVARFQADSARSRGSSFGIGSAGMSGLMDDADRSRDLSLLQLSDLMDPFAPELGLDELRPRHLDDITILDSQFVEENGEISDLLPQDPHLQPSEISQQTDPSQQTDLMEEGWEDIDGDELTQEQQNILARAIEEDERHEREMAENDIESLTREMEEEQALELAEEEKERARRAQELEEEAEERRNLENGEVDELALDLEIDGVTQDMENEEADPSTQNLEVEEGDQFTPPLELQEEDMIQDQEGVEYDSLAQTLELEDENDRPQILETEEDEFQRTPESEEGVVNGDGTNPMQEDVEMDGVVAIDEGEQRRRDEIDQHQDQEQDQTVPPQDEFDDGYMNLNEDHIERQEHEEQHGQSGVQYFDDFPSELGIMSNGNVLPTATVSTKKTARLSAHGLPVPSMPTSLQKQLMHTFTRSRISREAMDAILDGTHEFFEQAANDLAAYAEHAGRRTIDESDVTCLMQRLRIVNDKVSVESLMQRYLPRELRDLVLYPEDLRSTRKR